MRVIPHSKPWIDESDLRAVRDVMQSGMIAQGEQVREFEQEVARYVGCVGGIATASGTSAIVLALKGLLTAGHREVILPTYTCPSVLEAVLTVGAKPVVCDVGENWNMTPQTVGNCRSPRTGCIILVSTFGIANPVLPYRTFGVPIIEDCCQSFAPAATKDQGLGDARVFSFHATKCLTTGEGGVATSPNLQLLDTMRKLRDGGLSPGTLGYRVAAPMTDLQAALGRSQLARYDRFLHRRQQIARRYFDALKTDRFDQPWIIRDQSMFFRFPVRWPVDFPSIGREFARRGIHVRKGVDVLLHRLLGLDRDRFPVAENLFEETLSIPIYPALTDDEQGEIIDACMEIAAG
jgi:UDP-4-amino-4-deoxy-L-arabinose-oxoglutarate aminotransferase